MIAASMASSLMIFQSINGVSMIEIKMEIQIVILDDTGSDMIENVVRFYHTTYDIPVLIN